MKHACLKALCLLAIGPGFSVGQYARAADKPNVLLVLTDDQGYGDLSCHTLRGEME